MKVCLFPLHADDLIGALDQAAKPEPSGDSVLQIPRRAGDDTLLHAIYRDFTAQFFHQLTGFGHKSFRPPDSDLSADGSARFLIVHQQQAEQILETFTAHTLYSGVLEMESRASMVSQLAPST